MFLWYSVQLTVSPSRSIMSTSLLQLSATNSSAFRAAASVVKGKCGKTTAMASGSFRLHSRRLSRKSGVLCWMASMSWRRRLECSSRSVGIAVFRRRVASRLLRSGRLGGSRALPLLGCQTLFFCCRCRTRSASSRSRRLSGGCWHSSFSESECGTYSSGM